MIRCPKPGEPNPLDTIIKGPRLPKPDYNPLPPIFQGPKPKPTGIVKTIIKILTGKK